MPAPPYQLDARERRNHERRGEVHMTRSLGGGVLALALGALFMQIQAGPEPSIVWKGIDCGPGPIVREGPRLGSGVSPQPSRDPWSVPRPVPGNGPEQPTPSPPGCSPAPRPSP
jgi:hypothetical protein